MYVEQFINEKIDQLIYYVKAVLKQQIHYTELELFIWDVLEEWGTLNVENEMPSNARERVFWHVLHELSLHSIANLHTNLFFKTEIKTCIDFLDGIGSYPIDCVGWRP